MAVVTRKLARGRFSHWVTFEWKGKPVWKLIPGDKAEAKRLDTLWRKQRKEGTYRDATLFCPACGTGWVGTPAEVEQAERAQAAWDVHPNNARYP